MTKGKMLGVLWVNKTMFGGTACFRTHPAVLKQPNLCIDLQIEWGLDNRLSLLL